MFSISEAGSRAPYILSIVVVCAFALSTILSVRQNAQTIARLDAMASRLDAMNQQLQSAQQDRRARKVMTTHWISQQQPRELTTPWRELDPNEAFEAFLVRHKEEVRQAQAPGAFPKDL